MQEKDNKLIEALIASGLAEPTGLRLGDKFIRKTLVALKLLRNHDPTFPEATGPSQVEKVLVKLVSKAAGGRCNPPELQRRVDFLVALGARDIIGHVIERTAPPEKHQRLLGKGRWK